MANARRKLVTRYTGDKCTIHRRIVQGTQSARPGYVWAVFVSGLLKNGALELPESEFKYRGKYLSMLPEVEWLSADR